MNTYILVGTPAVNHFNTESWQDLEDSIECNNGDIIAWDNATDSVSELLNMLNGWNEFIELSKKDLNNIEKNTKIEIKRN